MCDEVEEVSLKKPMGIILQQGRNAIDLRGTKESSLKYLLVSGLLFSTSVARSLCLFTKMVQGPLPPRLLHSDIRLHAW
jgi:hypothetical protein